MRATIPLFLIFFFAINIAQARVPFWGDKESMPAETLPENLKPGQFVWDPGAVTSGPMVVVVSLTEQRAYVYRNGIRIGYTTVSSGRKGHRTPTGVFTILQKDKDHHSSIYHNASMPYTERLTWGGVALHAGGLPGYPSSHGCVHLPSNFAQALFKISEKGMTVVVADEKSGPTEVVHPGMLAPVSAETGEVGAEEELAEGDKFEWHPERSPEGPLSVLVSSADKQILVFRNGVEIGKAQITIDNAQKKLGTHAFVAMEGKDGRAGTISWIAVGIPGHSGEKGEALDPAETKRVHLPDSFKAELHKVLIPGATLMVTDASVGKDSSGVRMNVVTADPPPKSAG